jgi:peptide/nickel transport system permease protein
LISGWYGGATDRTILFVMDVVLGIPQILPLLLIDSMTRATTATMVVIVSASGWPVVGRLVRAETLALRQRDFISAARSLGASGPRIMLRHLIPNVLGVALAGLTSQVGSAVLVVATASYLGLGLPPPAPNWGSMIATAAAMLSDGYWWLTLFPGLAFVILQWSVNLIAEALRSAGSVREGRI